MDTVLKYRGREVNSGEVAFIRQLIAEEPECSRRALSQKICSAWGWVQPNGELRDAVCRGLMLELHRAGQITLPAARWMAKRPPSRRTAPAQVDVVAPPWRLC